MVVRSVRFSPLVTVCRGGDVSSAAGRAGRTQTGRSAILRLGKQSTLDVLCVGQCSMMAYTRESTAVIAQASAQDSSAQGSSNTNELLIVGPGVLGSYLGKLWLDTHGAGTVVGQTNTTTNHEVLKSIGISPRTGDDAQGVKAGQRFANVAYCAPPSGSEDYPGDIAKALSYWDGSGNFIFTSSAGVYSINDGSDCNESSPVNELGSNPRTDALLLAEKTVLEAGGCVMRLVGLYHRTRGPHTFFLKQGDVPRWGGYTVNMIHYEDAASICKAVLVGQGSDTGIYRSEVFVGCDGTPVTFQDMMHAIEESGVLPGHVEFTEKDGGDNKGKYMSNTATREQLQWSPKYSSVAAFFKQGAQDWYCRVQPTGMPHA
ncbi:hypothetical protein PSENEW3n2_00003704 [Picochlorum sp. SENEW3]|nr:hypothetical protein PSENEW3n2_00003704 [Picochlorum sp. SENEW3]WPT18404.1 hypothetical protein PSENEW3_00003704 [Picochlorum sp. SENEW3]